MDKTVEMNPRDAKSHVNRGIALGALGRHGEAVESFGRALSLDPGNRHASLGRAAALLQISRREEALASFDSILGPQREGTPHPVPGQRQHGKR
ncbi:MAG: tetratricopeptide repeat protein [Gammaproteobacteria bacterium]|nr:tetratricopeptide repeat protein [Gammaproteobacteria bacterium]